jgi:hypothetical protein
MTLDVFIRMLQAHLAALRSPFWLHPHDVGNGPALFLDVADTKALLAELIRVRERAARRSTANDPATPVVPSHE